jgi:choline kinase
MGNLSASCPKALIPIDGSHSALDLNLAALGDVAAHARATIVTGYRAMDFEAVTSPSNISLSTAFNAAWSARGPVLSILAGVQGLQLDAPWVVANGDTVFEPALLAAALQKRGDGITLFISSATPEPDDVAVDLESDNILEAEKAKRLLRPSSVISTGCVRVAGEAHKQAFLQGLAVLSERETTLNKSIIWHAVFSELHKAGQSARALFVDRTWWHEFDTADDILNYSRRPTSASHA